MFYHVEIETNEKNKNGTFITHRKFDEEDINVIKKSYAEPFNSGKNFRIDGYGVNSINIRKFLIKKSEKSTEEIMNEIDRRRLPGVFFITPNEQSVIFRENKYAKDITDEILSEFQEIMTNTSLKEKKRQRSNKVFIVHGRDDLLKTETARFLEKFGIVPIILHEQPNSGKTIIEKIEAYTDVDFGIILYTPCDEGRLKGEEQFNFRARQNVVLEHGFLLQKLGRKHVAALVKGVVEIPNDISGILYIPVDDAKAWQLAIAKELKASGFQIDFNLLY